MTALPKGFLRAEDERALPPLYATEDLDDRQKVCRVKWFSGSMAWYALELDAEPDEDGRRIAFGLVVSQDCPRGEFGYFDLAELAAARVRLPYRVAGQPGVRHTAAFPAVERDRGWFPGLTVAQVRAYIDEHGHRP